MKYVTRFALSTLILACPVDAFETPCYPGTSAYFAGPAEAAKLLGQSDVYTRKLTPYDLHVRLATDQDVTEADYLKLASTQLLKWSNEDIDAIAKILDEHRRLLQNFQLPLPNRITFAKSTCKEEGGASYCRGNTIVLAESMLKSMEPNTLKHLILHEMFHICSRQSEAWRKHMYAVIGFQPCNKLTLPKSLQQRLLTNPDAHRNDYYIEVMDGDEQVAAVPLLIGKGPKYDPKRKGGLFNAFDFRLVVIEKVDGGWQLAKTDDGKMRLIKPTENKAFLNQIGRNTNYIINPEEILADTFPMTILETRPQSPMMLARFLEALLMPPQPNVKDKADNP